MGNKVSVAIIDTIGLVYDGDTLKKRGLGGSESAVILMSKELVQVGFDVTVFNACEDDDSKPGVYDGVTYRPVRDVTQYTQFDVVISMRTVVPFVPEYMYEAYRHIAGFRYEPSLFEQIRKNARFKALWMHDTFCQGDINVEELVVGGYIDELFTLSDFHTSYIGNADHGKRRNFEVLKNKIFMTRNGVVPYFNYVDISKKDKNLFVYNASVTKGMIPLIDKVWPKVKERIPDAKLKVIGGYYRFRSDAPPDAQEETWRKLIEEKRYKKQNIEFTGVITQRQIAEILCEASMFLFPGAFPETFGISSLESLTYNTPLVATRFGALEETAIDTASYFIDYAIEPNGLFPNINSDDQVNKFVDKVVDAYYNTYLHQQKMNYCSVIKDINGWDTVAIQWKQHLYRKLGLYLSVDDYRRASYINDKVHRVFGRRFSNHEEWNTYRSPVTNHIAVVSTLYNAQDYVARCIESVACQDYENYTHFIVNDCSTDESERVIAETLQSLSPDRMQKVMVINRRENRGAPFNQVEVIRKYVHDDSIVMLLDGDDSLVNDNNVFNFYNNLYNGPDGAEFTYGSCWSMVDNIPLIAQDYPPDVKKRRDYRNYHFNWIMPYTHLRTFRRALINHVTDDVFKDESGEWFRAGGDGALFYAMIENADPNRVKAVKEIVYNYNDASPLNDYKVNGDEQNKTAKKILSKKTVPAVTETPEKKKVNSKKILIAIPTAKNIEVATFKSIYDLKIPEGYKADFQYFYGYNIDQVRNLIASWVVNGYDYLFAVDYDVEFESDTLEKMLAHDVDLVSGLYIQRKHNQHVLELYRMNDRGGMSNVPLEDIDGQGLVSIDGCGFGCVLVKKRVFEGIGYPWFVYHSALDHNNTVSEDVDFCRKAREKGFKMYADTTIRCDHHGTNVYRVGHTTQTILKNFKPTATLEDPVRKRLRDLGDQWLVPIAHCEYLTKIRDQYDFHPKVIYDIGACVLHWTKSAKRFAWPDADYVLFEAMDAPKFLYEEGGYKHYNGVMSDEDGKEVDFWENVEHPGGNSYYKENEEVNPNTVNFFNESHRVKKLTRSVDSVVREKKFPAPDMVKMDVQGAELDVLKGMKKTLKTVKHLILELQNVEYNKGAPLRGEVIDWLESNGFKYVELFSNQGPDGDYHFIRK